MNPAPAFEEFEQLARQGDLVPVWRELLFDTDTAVTAYAKLRRAPFGFLYESVVGGEKWARYTFLGTEPREAWRVDAGPQRRGGLVRRWTADGGWSAGEPSEDPLRELATLLRARRTVRVPGLPRFIGGAVGFAGYDMVRYIERLGEPPPDDLRLPQAVFMMTDVVLAIDNLFGRARAIALVDVSGDPDRVELQRRHGEAIVKLDRLARSLESEPAPPPLPWRQTVGDVAFESSYARADFERDVQRIRDYILDGDAFQVVLSQRLEMELSTEPFTLYRELRSLNPSPYLYFLELDGLTLVGSSPEVLVRLEDERVIVRPIAGTRRRGQTDEEDGALIEELLADEKERAEHLMLVDLGRNDVGRVARYGSVKVPEYMGIEKYSHVMHIVSQVEGHLREGLDAFDVFRACFPAGTVSGAPKIRAMQIIDELEPVRRGPYAGAVGYIAYGGSAMDTAIAIRTLVATGGRAYVQAGAGIVADSVPAKEYEETLAKARALLRVAAARR